MKRPVYFKEFILLALLAVSIAFSSCRCHEEEPQPLPYNYLNVPEGDTAIVEDLNITGMGARKNNPKTTWIIKGHVVMDELYIMGHVIIDEKASLKILSTIHVKAEGKLTVKKGELKYSELKQEGEIDYDTTD